MIEGKMMSAKVTPGIRFAMSALALMSWACGPAGDDGQTESSQAQALTKGSPGALNGDTDFCDDPANPCGAGEGDCDSDAQCAGSLICGTDNGERFGFPRKWDMCVPSHCVNGVVDTASGEIGPDCGGVCGTCPGPNQCYNGVFDAANGEESLDCGGPCEPCAALFLTVREPAPQQLFTTIRPTFRGRATPNQLLSLKIDGALVGQTTATIDGQWSFTVNADVAPGAHSLSVEANRPSSSLVETRQFDVVVGNAVGASLWGATYGGRSSTALYELSASSTNELYGVGFFGGPADFGFGEVTSQGRYDGFLMKKTAEGAPLWVKTFGQTGSTRIRSVSVAPNGDVVVAGYFDGSVDFGLGVRSASSAEDGFVARFDAAGNALWDYLVPGTGVVHLEQVRVSGDGQVIVVGNFTSSLNSGLGVLSSQGDFDIFLAKLSASGTPVWHKRLGSAGRDNSQAIAISPSNGDVVIGGLFRQSVDFGGGPVTAQGSYNAFIARYNAAGNHIWSKKVGGKDYDAIRTVAIDAFGEIVVGGFFFFTADFGGGPISAVGGYDNFVAKYRGNGEFRWARTFDTKENDELWQLRTDSQGFILVAGMYRQDATTGGPTLRLTGVADSYITKLSRSGTHLWTRTSNGPSAVIAYTVAVMPDDRVVTGGYFEGAANFGQGELANKGYRNMWIRALSK